jgi:hypothetical protein
MARVGIFLFAIELVLVVLALISCISAEPGQIRSLPRFAWIVLIVLFPIVGSIVYFLGGRPVKPGSASGKWRAGGGFPEPPRPSRPIAPDDDPEFLRKIDQQKKRDDDLLRRWEEDLKRRDEPRKQDPKKPDPRTQDPLNKDPLNKDPLTKDPRNKDKSSDDPSSTDG